MFLKNVSLKKYNTFGLEYNADYFVHIRTETEAVQAIRDVLHKRKPILIVGGGSNLLFLGDFHGTIIHPEIGSIYIEEEHPEYVIVSSGSGIVWDTLVGWAVNNGFGGLENLSFIPGSVGAASVQNIGAYGTEVEESVQKVRAIEITSGDIREFSHDDCKFGYRNSVFKSELKGKFLITKTFFKLAKRPVLALEYGSLREEAEKIGPLSLRTVRQAVINIRKSKLPDPNQIGNAGSFFKNPIVSIDVADSLKRTFPGIPAYPDKPGFIKMAAGWMIEQCGWKGIRIGDAGVHDKQALVLVNHGKATGREIYELSEKIRASVFEKFGVDLQREVEIIGTI